MSATLEIPNYKSINIKEESSLASGLDTVGETTLILVNNDNIVADDFILLGGRGSELGEIRIVSSADGATIIITDPTTLKHSVNSPVAALFGDKLKVYRASNTNSLPPADDAFSAVGDPIDIDPDQLSTKFTDPAGSSSYWYKFTYYNSTTQAESSLADSVATRGGGVGQYTSIDSIRHEAGFDKNRNIGDDLIEEQRVAATSAVNGAVSGRYVLPFTAPINPLITKITTMLAAGYLLLDQYGAYSTSDTNNGNDKIKWAEEQLKKIQAGQLVLVGPDGQPLPGPDGDNGSSDPFGMSGWPNDTTAAMTPGEVGAGANLFKVTDTVGYESRQY